MKKQLFIFFLLGFFLSGFCQDKIVKDLKIQGNKKLKSSFIRKIAKIEIGKVIDSTIIEQDIKRLKRLPSVSHAYYEVSLSNEKECNVVYNIEENFTIIPSINIYSTVGRAFAYRLGIYEYNLFGQNITFGGFYQNDIYSSYGINFKSPYLFNRKLGLAINVQDLKTQEPLFFDNSIANYKYHNKSYEILGLYELNFKNRFVAGVNYFLEEYTYKNGVTSASVPQNLSVKKVLYKAIYEYNVIDFNYQYVSGFKNNANFQYVTSTSDDLPEFLIARNDFNYYLRVGKKGNWANRIRIGIASNAKSPFAPFALDNNLNIRGVGNIVDRGTASIVINTEYRYTVLDKKWFSLQSNVFVDSGSWRKPGGKLSDFGDSENIKIFSGLGLRLIHKSIFNAIFRLDYGFGITNSDTQGLVFGIGQYF